MFIQHQVKSFNFTPDFRKRATKLMNPEYCLSDLDKIKRLAEIRKKNNDVAWMLCDFLNNNPGSITKDLILKANPDNSLPEEIVYCALFSAFCGLNSECNELDRFIVCEYLRPAIKKLETQSYLKNPYYQNIHIPTTKFGRWE